MSERFVIVTTALNVMYARITREVHFVVTIGFITTGVTNIRDKFRELAGVS